MRLLCFLGIINISSCSQLPFGKGCMEWLFPYIHEIILPDRKLFYRGGKEIMFYWFFFPPFLWLLHLHYRLFLNFLFLSCCTANSMNNLSEILYQHTAQLMKTWFSQHFCFHLDFFFNLTWEYDDQAFPFSPSLQLLREK